MRTRPRAVAAAALFSLLAASAIQAQGGIVRLSTAKPACESRGSNRFVGCEDGTVLDTVTRLLWLADASCYHLCGNKANWMEVGSCVSALSDGTCGLTDGSSPGDWRLPTADELNELLEGGRSHNCDTANSPCITNDAGTNCYFEGHESSFEGVIKAWYWTASGTTLVSGFGNNPASIGWDLDNCEMVTLGRYTGDRIAIVWPVRKTLAE